MIALKCPDIAKALTRLRSGKPHPHHSMHRRFNPSLWIQLLIALTCFGFHSATAAEPNFDPTHAAFSGILSNHVANGVVDYPRLVRSPAPLDTYLDQLATVPRPTFDQWSREDRIAFLINLYNASTLRLVRDHYPVTSIKKIGGLFSSPWKLRVVRVWGQTLTLDDIEHIHLRRDLPEPRIHFALVCAARGCPTLRPTAWSGATLDHDLNVHAREFLQDPLKNRLDREKSVLHLSPIFDWFGSDFTRDGKSLPEVIGSWMAVDDEAFLKTHPVTVRFNDYDWSLNGPQP